MPCGGIYPIKGTWLEKYLRDESKPESRCWVCQGEGASHFCDEWDCYIHARCVGSFLQTEEGYCLALHGHTVQLDFSCELEMEAEKLEKEPILRRWDRTYWWFDETESFVYGPYPTVESCRFDLDRYVKEVLNNPKEDNVQDNK